MKDSEAMHHLHEWQQMAVIHPSKRKLLLTGRQSGKTLTLKALIYSTALKGHQEILVTAPTHQMVKELLWRSFTRKDDPLFPPELVAYQNNQSLIIELKAPYYSRISFSGTENFSSLLGREVNLLVMDEYQSTKDEAWMYLEPCLATRGGTAVFTGTARKGNKIMDLYEKGQDYYNTGWKSWKITTPESGSPAGSRENIAMAKQSMSEEEFNQEFLCEPTVGEGLVFPSFSKANISDEVSIEHVLHSPNLYRLFVSVDFNVTNMNAIAGIVQGEKLVVVDEITLRHQDANSYEMAAEIRRRYFPKDGSRPNIGLIVDTNGRQRTSASYDTRITNHSVLESELQLPLIFDKRQNPYVEDSILHVNALFKPMIGEPKLFIHPKCQELINNVSKISYVGGKPDKRTGLDHKVDCLRYLAHYTLNRSREYRQLHLGQGIKAKNPPTYQQQWDQETYIRRNPTHK